MRTRGVDDRPGFDDFVATRSQALRRLAFLLTHDQSLAEDLVQTALVRSWQAWGRIDGDPEPYVRAVLVNSFTSWWRRRSSSEVPTEKLPETASPTHGVEERDLLWQALGRLPRRQQAVVVLRYYEDLSEAEIAAVLGISRGTVKSQCSKALAHLRVDASLENALEGS